MKRSTKIAPESLSTSYVAGSPCIGISMMTLKSLGRSLPEGTLFKLILFPWIEGVEKGAIISDAGRAAHARPPRPRLRAAECERARERAAAAAAAARRVGLADRRGRRGARRRTGLG